MAKLTKDKNCPWPQQDSTKDTSQRDQQVDSEADQVGAIELPYPSNPPEDLVRTSALGSIKGRGSQLSLASSEDSTGLWIRTCLFYQYILQCQSYNGRLEWLYNQQCVLTQYQLSLEPVLAFGSISALQPYYFPRVLASRPIFHNVIKTSLTRQLVAAGEGQGPYSCLAQALKVNHVES